MAGPDENLKMLDALLAGAGQLVESAEAWAARLDGVPGELTGRFVIQLRAEWPEVRPPDALCAQVAGRVRERM